MSSLGGFDMNKIVLVLVWVLLLPITIITEEEQENEIRLMTEYMPFRDVEQMTDRTSDIVKLEILDERIEWVNIWEGIEDVPVERNLYDIHTIHRARVLNVFKGDSAVGDIIEIMQEGGNLDGITLINESAVNFSYGDNVVLFLHNPIEFPFTIINPYQGAYLISDDGMLVSYHNHPADNLGLTWDVLDQIQYNNGNESTLIIVENNVDTENNDNVESSDGVENSDIESNVIIIVGVVLAISFAMLVVRIRNKKNE